MVRGKGVGSRKDFTLPAKWKTVDGERGGVEFVSPGKTVYKTQKSVKDVLQKRKLSTCLRNTYSSESSEDNLDDDPDCILYEKETQVVEKETKVMDTRHIQPIEIEHFSTADCNGEIPTLYL